MSRIFRFIAEFANLFNGMFGSGFRRSFSRESLENLVGPFWTRIILAVPIITVVVWIGIYVGARLLDLPEGQDPFTWMHETFGPK